MLYMWHVHMYMYACTLLYISMYAYMYTAHVQVYSTRSHTVTYSWNSCLAGFLSDSSSWPAAHFSSLGNLSSPGPGNASGWALVCVSTCVCVGGGGGASQKWIDSGRVYNLILPQENHTWLHACASCYIFIRCTYLVLFYLYIFSVLCIFIILWALAMYERVI